MKVTIVGAGAIGLWIAGRLSETNAEVSLLARGQAQTRVLENGITIKESAEDTCKRIPVSDDAKDFGLQDLVIFAVKAQDLPTAAVVCKALINENTSILPAMNGVPWWFLEKVAQNVSSTSLLSVDPEGSCANFLPSSQVLGGVIHASCLIEQPGVVRHVMGNGFIIGSASELPEEKVKSVATLLTNAKFNVTVSQDIRYDIWYKLWGNMTMNPLSALTRSTCDVILDNSETRQFASDVMNEASRIGSAIGCPIKQTAEDRHEVTRKLGAFKTSMLQDAESGKQLELGALLEAPQEIARLVGINTPALDRLLGLMRVASKGESLK
jgi:2-dehydropantoate 2-reductase